MHYVLEPPTPKTEVPGGGGAPAATTKTLQFLAIEERTRQSANGTTYAELCLVVRPKRAKPSKAPTGSWCAFRRRPLWATQGQSSLH